MYLEFEYYVKTPLSHILYPDCYFCPQPDVTYRLTGVSDGPDYFNISQTTGNIFVKADLRGDLNKKNLYLVI